MKNYDAFYIAARNFVAACDNILAVYLDSTMGFNNNVDELERKMQGSSSFTGSSPFGIQAPDEIEKNLILHQTTVDDFLKRNSINDFNYIKLGQFAIILVFTYWENTYRSQLGQTLGLTKNDVLIDVLGDIRDLRNDLLHNSELVSKKTAERAKVIKCIEGARIDFTMADVCHIFAVIKRSIDDYCIDQFDLDPDFSLPTYAINPNW
jgi:hypothetical protein